MNCVRFNWKSFTVSIIWWQCTIFECCSCSSAFWISTEKLTINKSKHIHCLVRYGSIIFGKRWETSRRWYQKLNGNAIVMRTPEGIRTNLIIELIIYPSYMHRKQHYIVPILDVLSCWIEAVWDFNKSNSAEISCQKPQNPTFNHKQIKTTIHLTNQNLQFC